MDYVVQPMIGNEVCVKKEEKPTKLRVIFDSAPDEEGQLSIQDTA